MPGVEGEEQSARAGRLHERSPSSLGVDVPGSLLSRKLAKSDLRNKWSSPREVGVVRVSPERKDCSSRKRRAHPGPTRFAQN